MGLRSVRSWKEEGAWLEEGRTVEEEGGTKVRGEWRGRAL